MKCANLHSINDLRYEDIPMPVCAEDEVIIAVKCCGICGSDIPRVYEKGTYHFPTVIGHEFSGQVVHDPENALTGKAVAVFPLLPCFSCESCRQERYATCENYDYYGSRRNGGMSEYLAVKRWNLVSVPENLSYREAAMCEPAAVARHAASKLQIKKGDTMLISGAGPIGILAGQWARLFGAKQVYYFDIDQRKLEFCKSFGFAEYTQGTQISCALEGTGHPGALEKCLDVIEPKGRMVLMGNPAGDMPMTQKTYWHILKKELSVFGTWNSAYSQTQNDWQAALTEMASGRLDVKPLITHVFPLKDVQQAFDMVRNKTEFFNKVMLTMEEENDTL
ncbi:MAG: galactitol-1-phosphate 5-dehydrogenase [Oscillospiraceae bacterium]|nr:galactitol-1-phosphate 5-dehydrogenase [Oscillospiraceae bacterium]